MKKRGIDANWYHPEQLGTVLPARNEKHHADP